MNDPDDLRLGLDPSDLDGHTIEELTDYLDSGRSPRNPSIDDSAGCALALDALERLRGLTPELVAADTAAEPAVEQSWVQSILNGIAMDARAGRRIPLAVPDEHQDLGITEGAVRGLIRGAESAVPGVLIGRSRLHGDITQPDAEVRVEIDASVPFGQPLVQIAERLRVEVDDRLRTHTRLSVTGIDIRIHDISTWKGIN